HNMLVMETELAGSDQRKRRFIFDSRWINLEGFEDCVKKAWGHQCPGQALYKFQKKLRSVKFELLGWVATQKSNTAKLIKECNAKLEIMGQQGGHRDWLQWAECKSVIHKAYRDEEAYWKQKARVTWLREGDRNTKFFQACVKQISHRNSLEHLIKLTGEPCRSRSESLKEVADFLTKLFTSDNPTMEAEVLIDIPKSISEEMNKNLIKPVTEEEIRQALWAMDPHKAPGID
ncbi:Unknown protein, partial [Striga hermonthica]